MSVSEYHSIPKPPRGVDPWDSDYYNFVDKVDANLKRSGTLAERPNPSDVPDGCWYEATDEDLVFRKDESAGWVKIAGTGTSNEPLPDSQHESINGVHFVRSASEIQSKINDAAPGEEVVILPGDYTVTEFSLADGLTLTILGTLTLADGENSNVIDTDNQSDVTVRGLHQGVIDGNKANQTYSPPRQPHEGVQATKMENFTIRGMEIRNVIGGACLVVQGDNVTVENNYIHDGGLPDTPCDAMFVSGQDIHVHNNYLINVTDTYVACDNGEDLLNEGNFGMNTSTFNSNYSSASLCASLWAGAADTTGKIINNTFINPGPENVSGITTYLDTADGTVTDALIKGNRIIGKHEHTVEVGGGVDNVRVLNNLSKGANGHAFPCESSDTKFRGNVVLNGAMDAFNFSENVTDCEVSHNTVRGMSGAAYASASGCNNNQFIGNKFINNAQPWAIDAGEETDSVFAANDPKYTLATGSFTLPGGADQSLANDVPSVQAIAAPVSTDQTQKFSVLLSVESDPGFNADYSYKKEVFKKWKDDKSQVEAVIEASWGIDPGSGNDLELRYEVVPEN